jgi:hypothetical protein
VNTTEVTSVPGNVSPHGRLESVVHSERSLLGNNLLDDINHSVVLSGGGLVLETNLNELERNDDEGLGGSGGGSGKDGKSLGLLVDSESLAVELAPLVIGGELGSTGKVLGAVMVESGQGRSYRLGASIKMGAEIPR